MAPNASSFSNSSLTPPPYPVLINFAILSVFVGASWYSSFESAKDTAGEHLNWILLATPVALIFLARLASRVECPEEWVLGTLLDRQWRSHHRVNDESGDWGTSPWAVGGAIFLVLVLVQFQSSFHDAWFSK